MSSRRGLRFRRSIWQVTIDGKTVRGARNRNGKAPHLVAALAHGIGAVLGQVAVDAKSNECVWPGGHPGGMKWSECRRVWSP
jgi:hypothetical protein